MRYAVHTGLTYPTRPLDAGELAALAGPTAEARGTALARLAEAGAMRRAEPGDVVEGRADWPPAWLVEQGHLAPCAEEAPVQAATPTAGPEAEGERG